MPYLYIPEMTPSFSTNPFIDSSRIFRPCFLYLSTVACILDAAIRGQNIKETLPGSKALDPTNRNQMSLPATS